METSLFKLTVRNLPLRELLRSSLGRDFVPPLPPDVEFARPLGFDQFPDGFDGQTETL